MPTKREPSEPPEDPDKVAVTRSHDQSGAFKDGLLILFSLLCVAGAVTRVVKGQIDETTLLYVGVAAAMLVVREISSLAIGDKFKLDFKKQMAEVKEAAATAKDVAVKAAEGADAARNVAEAIIEDRIGGTKGSPRGDAPPRRAADRPTAASSAAPEPVLDPDDHQRGRWGGKSEAGGRKLSARVTPVRDDDDWFTVRIVVDSTDPAKPLTGSVTFHLHQSFSDMDPSVKVRNGRAVLSTVAWGAFTVGAETDEGTTRLELNLAELADAPKAFRER